MPTSKYRARPLGPRVESMPLYSERVAGAPGGHVALSWLWALHQRPAWLVICALERGQPIVHQAERVVRATTFRCPGPHRRKQAYTPDPPYIPRHEPNR
jgi:hypothetical protein